MSTYDRTDWETCPLVCPECGSYSCPKPGKCWAEDPDARLGGNDYLKDLEDE